MRSSGRGMPISLGLLGLVLVFAFESDPASARPRGPVPDDAYRTALTKTGLGIVRSPAPFLWTRGALAEIPAYDPAGGDPWQMDLRGYDLRKCDLAGRWSATFPGRPGASTESSRSTGTFRQDRRSGSSPSRSDGTPATGSEVM